MAASDTCGIRTHAGRPHRLSRPTPWPLGQSVLGVRESTKRFKRSNLCLPFMRWTAGCMGVLELLVGHCGSAAVHAGAGGLHAWALAGQPWRQAMRSGEMGHMIK